ncbi:type II toxin-antitoxin system HicA family toxin [archaeon]|nr:type II toxin-antitoxin system HicA family toxin [archaeon]NCP98286.1 type II toxin-antitoxin system HicA family toxin [archaeon]NCQ07410.1 type II toxin-antitoxin system HicA family toxin [archaeon]NCT58960.1 type II toxin-antitoxin system HicA family toxin [archaeon]
MDKLPIISGQDLIKLLLKLDYQVHHQTGSHIILRQNKEPFRRLTIPNHKEISIGTLRAIIRQVGITREEFVKLF